MNKYSKTIVAQQDYVRSNQLAPSRRQKSRARKKYGNIPFISPSMIAIAATMLVTFISMLYFITYHKKEKSEAHQDNEVTGNSLPPKPEERWRYIKELESRQPDMRAPTELSTSSEMRSTNQPTDKQRQLLLAQIQTDTRQQRNQLNEVPWNKKMATQHLKTQKATSVAKGTDKPKLRTKIKDDRLWMVQCGSFKVVEQAEIVRAQLAFAGFDSRVTYNNGWNRVLIGPIKGKNNADGTISRLKMAGHTDCIQLTSGVETPNLSPIYHSIKP